MSESKTCGQCRHFAPETDMCCLYDDHFVEAYDITEACDDFEQKNPTNGDRIRQGGDDALIDFADGIRRRMCHYCVYSKDKSCVDKTGDCWEGIRAWLNAPADNTESEGKDE
jgi:hypothetical protein